MSAVVMQAADDGFSIGGCGTQNHFQVPGAAVVSRANLDSPQSMIGKIAKLAKARRAFG
jgi:hypothetical protein